MDAQLHNSSEECAIKKCLCDGYSYCEILCFFCKVSQYLNFFTAVTQNIKKYGLFSRKNCSSLNQVILTLKMFIFKNLAKCGPCFQTIFLFLMTMYYLTSTETNRMTKVKISVNQGIK